MGYEESAEASATLTHQVAYRTLEEGQRIFPELRGTQTSDIKSAWSGRVYCTIDNYPFVDRTVEGHVVTFGAPSDHDNALAVKVGELAGGLAADIVLGLKTEQNGKRHRETMRQLKLFEEFPRGQRLRPGRRYQVAASGQS